MHDLDRSEAFYARLGFGNDGPPHDDYRILADGKGGRLHLTAAVDDWLVPGRNPFGLYLYVEDVDALASAFAGEIIGSRQPREDKPRACTSSPSATQTRPWCESAGRRDCARPPEPGLDGPPGRCYRPTPRRPLGTA